MFFFGFFGWVFYCQPLPQAVRPQDNTAEHTEDEAGQRASSKETVIKTTADREVKKRKKTKVIDEKRVGSPVADLRQSLLSQADGQSAEGRQSKASADKLDTAVSNMSKESRDLESTGGRPHPRDPRSDVGEGKQKSDQAAGNPVASRIERDKSQVRYLAYVVRTVHICSSCLPYDIPVYR